MGGERTRGEEEREIAERTNGLGEERDAHEERRRREGKGRIRTGRGAGENAFRESSG